MNSFREQAVIAFGASLAGAVAAQQDDLDLLACGIIRHQPKDVAALAILYADVLIESISEMNSQTKVATEFWVYRDPKNGTLEIYPSNYQGADTSGPGWIRVREVWNWLAKVGKSE